MDCRVEPGNDTPRVALALALVVAGMLSACSDIYYDRRETVALGADDHIASNRVAQMIDPWPRYVEKRAIAFNGEKMQSAVERYRTNRVIPPVNVTTSSAAYQAAEQSAAASVAPPTSATPAAPVK
jgi:hypothetical protein